MVAVNVAAWQAHAEQRLAAGAPGPLSPPTRLELTHYPGHGPGAELLGTLRDRRVVELGCGPGRNLAYLVAHHGALGVGVDAVPAQVKRARAHYRHLPGIDFTAADATTYLTTTATPLDMCLSIFGAIGLTRPDPLLAAVTARLRPRGRLVFSVPHQAEDPGAQPIADSLAFPTTKPFPSSAGH